MEKYNIENMNYCDLSDLRDEVTKRMKEILVEDSIKRQKHSFDWRDMHDCTKKRLIVELLESGKLNDLQIKTITSNYSGYDPILEVAGQVGIVIKFADYLNLIKEETHWDWKDNDLISYIAEWIGDMNVDIHSWDISPLDEDLKLAMMYDAVYHFIETNELY